MELGKQKHILHSMIEKTREDHKIWRRAGTSDIFWATLGKGRIGIGTSDHSHGSPFRMLIVDADGHMRDSFDDDVLQMEAIEPDDEWIALARQLHGLVRRKVLGTDEDPASTPTQDAIERPPANVPVITDIVVQDLDTGVRLLTLDRPAKKNALTGAMYDAMREALEQADASDDIGAVVFAGQPGVFSAGNDLADFVGQAERGFSAAPPLRFIRQLARTRTPMVAAVDGIAVGIGATLTLHCDLVYAAPAARLRLPFVELGLVPEAASSYLLPLRVGRLKAAELLLLSEPLDADGALALGLVNAVIPADLLIEHALAQAGRLAALPRGALAASRALIRGDQAKVEAAIEAEAKAFDAQLQSPESQERLRAFLSRAKPASP